MEQCHLLNASNMKDLGLNCVSLVDPNNEDVKVNFWCEALKWGDCITQELLIDDLQIQMYTPKCKKHVNKELRSLIEERIEELNEWYNLIPIKWLKSRNIGKFEYIKEHIPQGPVGAQSIWDQIATQTPEQWGPTGMNFTHNMQLQMVFEQQSYKYQMISGVYFRV